MTAASVIVPTRNESANVAVLADRLMSTFAASGIDGEVIFVDDSDDSTPDEIERLSRRQSQVRMLHRPPGRRCGGLAGAVLAGVELATAEVVAVMDGDLQHPPEVLGRLLEPVLSGTGDIAVATRFGAGGSCRGLDGVARLAVSRSSRLAARIAVPRSRTVSDPLGGFFALRRSMLTDRPLQAEGFKVLLEILACTPWERAVEVPYEFAARRSGESNASLRTGWQFLCQLVRLARRERRWPAAAVPARGPVEGGAG